MRKAPEAVQCTAQGIKKHYGFSRNNSPSSKAIPFVISGIKLSPYYSG